MTLRDAQLVLADGTLFEGEAIGADADDGVAAGEVVFNTVLTGYQEVISDPSYAGQIITFTYPHIGNYGVADADDESRKPFCRGVVVRELARRRSNWRSNNDLDSYLRRFAVPGIAGVDTRRLTKHIRDAGSPADTRWIDERDDLPKIIRAGRHIARTRRYIRNFAHEIEPEQLVSRVRAEARAGDGWVKLVGDWIDRDAGDPTPCWPREALIAAIAAAHEEGARVTAHCFGEESLADFAAAGTDCIEHATGLVPETVEAFASQGIAIVPTLVNIETFPQIAAPAAEKFPQYHRHMLELHERRFETIAAAHEAGVDVYVGTDAGGSLPHGLVAQEMELLTRAGFSTLEALSAGTWSSRAWLGRPGITEGEDADLVVLSEDPRDDVRACGSPEHVILRGNRVGGR